MKIALVSPYDFARPGGVATHINALSREFRARGHDVRIIAPCSSNDAPLPYIIKASGSVQAISYAGTVARISLSPRMYHRVKRILAQEQFDVIHLHEPLTPGLTLAVLRHLGVCPESLVVGTFHAYQEAHKGYALGKPLFRRIIRRLDGRIAVSEAARDYAARYFPGEYAIIPNGIDPERFGSAAVQPLAAFSDDRPNVLFVGRLEQRKGLAYLLRAFARVQSFAPQTRLLVVGASERDEQALYVALSRELGLRHVHFVGQVSDDDLPRYYRSSHLFCAPSIGFESFGLVLLEAMAAGVPVIATDIRGYRSVVGNSGAGLLVPPKDAAALAQAIIQLLQDPRRRQDMAQQGRARSLAYNWPHIADRILSFYRRLRLQRDVARRQEIDEWEVEHARG
ncbi:MAG: glycosyltransferase family 4 protein [Chloroflexota bacterium]